MDDQHPLRAGAADVLATTLTGLKSVPDRFYRDTPEYRRASFWRGFRRGFIRINVILSPLWAFFVWYLFHQLSK